MRSDIRPALRVLTICVLASILGSVAFTKAQDQSKDQASQISEGEQKAIEKIKAANGPEAKLKASAEYIKKYSKSPMRPRIADYVSNEIISAKDSSQKISLAQNFISTFNQPNEADLIKPALVEAYFNAGKFDEALSESSKQLEKNPNDVVMLTQVAWGGAIQAQKQAAAQQAPSPKLTQAALDAGNKAVELMEGDKKPAAMTAENWASYRNSWLPRLYQAQGVMLYYINNKAGAREKLEKAVGFDPYDPPTLMMLINLSNEEYQDLAKKYQTDKKPDSLNQALAKMDELIDWLARMVAATEGNAQYQASNAELKDNLKQYYTFRHDGKTDGMNELLQKYKKP